MQRFFEDFQSLDRFTLSLDCHAQAACPHCLKSNQLVSHGVLYRQRSIEEREAVGKRVFCSNRYRHSGCGRTFPLYLSCILPGLRHGAAQLSAFLSALLRETPVETAYRQATAQAEPRHTWRWLAKLADRLPDYRRRLHRRPAGPENHFRSPSRRLRLLLPTLQTLLSQLSRPTRDCPCARYQLHCQSAFI